MDFLLPDDWKWLGPLWPSWGWLDTAWPIIGVLVVVGLIVAYVLLQLRHRNYAVRFTNIRLIDKIAPRRPNWRRHVPAVAFLLAMIFVVMAAGRPAYAIKVPRQRATVVLAMDISPSMLATDVKPNRLKAAKDAAKEFVDEVPGRINVSLVSFSRGGNIRVPPTTDKARMETGIDDLKVDKYTAIGEGVFASLDAIKLAPKPKDGSDKRVPAAVILMSDGESTVGRSNQEAADAARQQKVPVSTIAFGTENGTVTIPPNPFPQSVPPDPDALRMIAEETRGKFYEAADAQQLKKVYEDLGSSIGYEKKYKETTGVWASVGVALLIVTAILGLALTNKFP